MVPENMDGAKLRKTPRSMQYSALETERAEDASEDEDYTVRVRGEKVPWGALCLAFGLLLTGIIFFTLSFLHMRGHFFSKRGAGWGFFTLGCLTFIPGFFHTRIAYLTWRGQKGYSYSRIPMY